jgi:hypothetical protein
MFVTWRVGMPPFADTDETPAGDRVMTDRSAADSATDSMASFRRFSHIVRTLVATVRVLLPLLILVYAFGFSEELARRPDVLTLNAVPAPLGFWWSAAAFAVLLLAIAPVLYALNAAQRLFSGYAHGQVFTVAAANDVRRIAIGLLFGALIGPFASVGMSLVLSGAGNAHGIAVSVGSDQFFFALFGLVFWGIARVMREAAAMAEDHAAIV